MKFADKCVAGHFNDLVMAFHDAVDAWHEDMGMGTLFDFLGVTREEYIDIILDHKQPLRVGLENFVQARLREADFDRKVLYMLRRHWATPVEVGDVWEVDRYYGDGAIKRDIIHVEGFIRNECPCEDDHTHHNTIISREGESTCTLDGHNRFAPGLYPFLISRGGQVTRKAEMPVPQQLPLRTALGKDLREVFAPENAINADLKKGK